MTAWSSRCSRLVAGILLVLPIGAAWADAPAPIFAERFAYDPAEPAALFGKWLIPGGINAAAQADRLGLAVEPDGRTVGRITVHEGDAIDGATPAVRAARGYVCGKDGSRALQMEAVPGGVAPSERSELQLKYDRETGAGELVKFDQPVWYRFGFKLAADWPSDDVQPELIPCRTVIHQIKQDAFRDGKSCSASPFFKIEARPTRQGAQFFAQVTSGKACVRPSQALRVPFCTADVPRDTWVRVNVRLFPAHDDSGRADVWLDGRHCGRYRGPMADPENGATRDGRQIVNAQPRFGLYRDWRAETQSIFFDRIEFWNADPTGHPDWGATPEP